MRNTRIFGKFGFAVAGLAAAGIMGASAAQAQTNVLKCTFDDGQAITATGKLGCVDSKLTVKIGSGSPAAGNFQKLVLTCVEANANVALDPYTAPFGFGGVATTIDGMTLKGVLKGFGSCNLATPTAAAYLPSGKVSVQYYQGAVKLKAKSDAYTIIGGQLAPAPAASLSGIVTKGTAIGALVTTDADINVADPINVGANGIVTCSTGGCVGNPALLVTEIALSSGANVPGGNELSLDLPF